MGKIFETYSFRNLQLCNRVVRSATNDYSGEKDGSISEKQIQLYEMLAKAEVGLIITGNFYVSEDGRLDATQNAITAKQYDLNGAKKLVQTIHGENGTNTSKIVFQIAHAGRKTKVNADIAKKYEKAEQIDKETIERIEKDFAQAVSRCAQAGADGVQIHFGHGYLLGELLDERADGLEIAETIFYKARKEEETYPILVKVNTDMDQRTLLGFYELCEKYGVWAIELSGNTFSQKKQEDHNYYASEIDFAKKHCTLPVILTGGIRSIEDGEAALRDRADLIGMSRPFICEPMLLHNQWEKKSKCISCCQCFSLHQSKGKHCIFE